VGPHYTTHEAVSMEVINFTTTRAGVPNVRVRDLSGIHTINLNSQYSSFRIKIADEGIELDSRGLVRLFMLTVEIFILHSKDWVDSGGSNTVAYPVIRDTLLSEVNCVAHSKYFEDFSKTIDDIVKVIDIAKELEIHKLSNIGNGSDVLIVPYRWFHADNTHVLHVATILPKRELRV